jgi:serine/threonine-protein kinase
VAASPDELPTEGGGSDAQATVPAKKGAVAGTSSVAETQPGSQKATQTMTPEGALLDDEIARTKLFLRVCAVLSAVLGICTPLLSGTREMRIAVFACCIGAMGAVLLFSRALRNERGYTTARWLAVSTVLMIASCIGVYFIGVFSPAPMVGTLGIYFLCLGSSTGVALAAWLIGASLHALPAVLIALHLLPDPGLFKADNVGTTDKLLAAVLVQVVFALTFVLARGSRRSTRSAVEKLHQALAQVQKREALLAEAHLDLDRALRAGVAGRFSDRRLGPYQLGPVIGRGAMSEVYSATHEGGKAAVKVLHRDLISDPHQVRRFLREAEIVSNLRSKYIVRVLSFGNFGGERLDEDPPYIAMELLEGHDLAWHLRRERVMPADRVLELVDQVADALTDAESHEVVHRDLKPQNLFCAQPDGDTGPRSWKVLDFGVSKLSTGSGTLTKGAIIGTPGYMAPEQARGGEVGPRSDEFALAVIAYRALTGRPAFAGKDMPRVLFDVCYAQPARPGRFAPLGEDVERALAIGMAKKPEDRFPSARAFADALREAVAERLPPPLRSRADTLLVSLPWGTRPERA